MPDSSPRQAESYTTPAELRGESKGGRGPAISPDNHLFIRFRFMANELAKALCGFYADVGVIQQGARGAYGQFADLPTVLSTVLPALAKHNLIQSQTFEPGAEGQTILVTTLMHISGESIVSRLPLITNQNKNAMFAVGGSITYFRRYALLSILGLSADVEADPEDYKEPPAPAPVDAKPVKATTGRKPKTTPLSIEKGPNGEPSERDEVINSIKQLPKETSAQLLNDFRSKFKITGPTVADHITNQVHAKFIADTIKALAK